ncbi:hypothetical protein RHMOL_Rhmol03G0021000 [Rhododendron molle]|uniref:Uncharacterized protein n=1 Tax=Rhododendron molle TaxID=49168 RepID=A0ACC0PAP1_RHOML|nr:hypothetical protein RHMOL_Rhmol03G0021000 [Rhododendron molle]
MASTSSEAPPPSSPAETPTVNNSTKIKSNSSKRSFVANFKAKFCVSKPKPLENNHHNAASTSTATTNKNDDHGRAALSLSSKMIRNDLLAVDSAFAEAKKYMDHMNVKINQAHEKFEDLQTLGGSQRDFDELRKDVMKLKFQIPSHGRIRSADSNPRRNRWPNINEAEDGMSHFFYKEPEDTHTGDFDGLLEAFHGLSRPWQRCLLCFFKFPPAAIIKRKTMIYLWIGLGLGYTWLSASNFVKMIFDKDDYGNSILNEFVEKGFIQPIYQNCSLAPDSCRMSISVRSALYEVAKASGFTSKGNLDLDLENDNLDLVVRNDRGHILGHTCLINVGEAVINWESEIFANTENIRSLCLGRWQSSTTHHIELADVKILHGLKDLKSLTFLSLRGISMITELPTSILELKNLAILDLQACHNLEAIPEDIGLLDNLTHLDMSECYFLEHMPESLAQLSNLEVLKGFLIGDFNNNKQSCTLHDLSRLRKLRKFNIYVTVKDFRRLWDFDDLENFKGLQKLTISWGGCSLLGESRRLSLEEASMELLRRGPQTLPPRLQKLDLQCLPTKHLTDWLRPAEIEGLKKLYIRGGQLCDLGQIPKHASEQWNVEILRLKYLSKLKIDWSELRILCPKLIYFHQEECPELTNFPCDERGVINSSPMSSIGSSPTSALGGLSLPDSPVDEEQAIPEDIGLLKRLTLLDISECYFLEHMPESLAEPSNLEVLKGFLIGHFKNNKQSCTLSDLSRVWNLRKLKIYVRVKDFRRLWDLDDLKKFEPLENLTISWGGCSLHGESRRQSQEEASMELLRRGPLTLPPRLQKLDFQGFPIERLTDCLRPEEIKGLNKLYIRGGQLCDLGQSRKHQGEQWNVEILRLKYLSKLKIDWSELRRLFPELIYLHQEECPKLTNSPCNERGVWMNMEAIDSNMQLQKYFKTSGMISSSSMSGSDPTLAQDDSKICPVDEKQLS